MVSVSNPGTTPPQSASPANSVPVLYDTGQQTLLANGQSIATSQFPLSSNTVTNARQLWDKLRRGYEINRNTNPHTLPVMTSPPTETLLAAMPVGYQAFLLQSSAGTPTGIAGVTGGDPVNFTGGYRVQVASRISGGNVSTTTDATAFRFKFIVDSLAPVFLMLNNPNPVRFLVRTSLGMQYVETTGVTPSNAGYGNFIQLTFGSRAVREIWVETFGSAAMFSVGVLPNESVKPAEVGIRGTILGDSLDAGTLTGANTNQGDGIFNVMADCFGFYDARFSGIASTGILAPSTQYNLIQRLSPGNNAAAFITDAPPSDVFVICMGTNDTTFTYAQLVAGMAQCLQLLLTQYPTTPIIVIGCPPGKPGPNEPVTTVDVAYAAGCAQVNSPLVVFIPNASRTPYPPVWGAGAVTVPQAGTLTATATISAATTCTLTAGFPGVTGGYQINFSDGTQKFINITNNTTTLTWTGAVTASATILYSGMFGSLVFTAAVPAGATSATLTPAFSNHGLNSTAYVTFSSGEIRQVTLTGGSTGCAWTDPLLLPASTLARWNDSTTYAGPSDLYFTTASGAHPNSAGALNFGLDYADTLYGALKSL